ncbi:MAG: glycoside hydrolase family 16 protein [Mycolicibacterium sp.]|nr:glycoside hydrolase family 16 protein [Mycolicibacterium sp.]
MFEDFLGPAGSSPNPDLWVADTGSSAENGWEQGSLQDYTDAADNIRLDGHGSLIIEARRSGDDYTSGRLVTRAKVSFPFGTVSARIKFPAGQGIWPAFWMLGSDIDSVGWPQCGEVDIMELTGTGTEYHVSLHGPKLDIGISSQPTGNLTENFHTYWVTRHRDDMRIGVDDTTSGAFTPSALPPGAEWVFNGPMFVLLNVAVGGDWPGPPDRSTRFPATMVVDWFRFDPSSR